MRYSALLLIATVALAAPIKVLIVDGQNNHKWAETTPVMKKMLEDTGLFQVDVATSGPKGTDISGFQPEFKKYQVVLSNYSDYGGGSVWPEPAQRAFEVFVRNGGGFVSVHAADNAFPNWAEYNKMIALGGWMGRDEKSGPYVRWRDGQVVRDTSPGKGGHHGRAHPYQVVTRDKNHPITRGLPGAWMHAQDELYDSLRGPAENLSVLATAFSDKSTGGTGEHEPALMTIQHGKGRVFHTILGHDVGAMQCVGFIVTLQRGVEWAATGKVTQKLPKDFPGAEAVQVRK
jgi:type 1 glutamine amidotransferase